MFRGSVKSNGYPLYSPVSTFTSPPVCHRVPSHFNWSLLIQRNGKLQPGRVAEKVINWRRLVVRSGFLQNQTGQGTHHQHWGNINNTHAAA